MSLKEHSSWYKYFLILLCISYVNNNNDLIIIKTYINSAIFHDIHDKMCYMLDSKYFITITKVM